MEHSSRSDCMKCKCGGGSGFSHPEARAPEKFVVNVNTNLHSVSSGQPSVQVQPPAHRLSSRFEMADEEGQFMDPSTIDSSQLFGSSHQSSFSSVTTQHTTESRLAQLVHRNSML